MIKLKEIYQSLILEKLSDIEAVNIFSKYGVPFANKLSLEELKKKWLKLVKMYHSDISKNNDVDALKYINSAYDVLKKGGINIDTNTGSSSNSNIKDIRYYENLAWEISGKPAKIPANYYSFWNWDGFYFRGMFSVYTTEEHWYEVSKLLVEWDHLYRSIGVFVSSNVIGEHGVLYLINHKGVKVVPPKEFKHDSFNKNPSNDWKFTDTIRKAI